MEIADKVSTAVTPDELKYLNFILFQLFVCRTDQYNQWFVLSLSSEM